MKSNTVEMLSSVLADKRRNAGLTQKYIAFKCNKSRQQLQKIEHGDRELKVRDLIIYLESIDDPILYLQTIYLITNGLFGIKDLDDDEIHPAVMYFRFNTDIQKLLQMLRKYPLVDKKIDKDSLKDVLSSMIELTQTLMSFIAVVSKFYNVSLKENIKKVDCESTFMGIE